MAQQVVSALKFSGAQPLLSPENLCIVRGSMLSLVPSDHALQKRDATVQAHSLLRLRVSVKCGNQSSCLPSSLRARELLWNTLTSIE
jgi:hypothetical protein